jgi:hypothetical protein
LLFSFLVPLLAWTHLVIFTASPRIRFRASTIGPRSYTSSSLITDVVRLD